MPVYPGAFPKPLFVPGIVRPNGPKVHLQSHTYRSSAQEKSWPVGPNTARHSRIEYVVRPIYQGFALRWMNGWTFGPDDFPYFCAKYNRPAGSVEQRVRIPEFLHPRQQPPLMAKPLCIKT
jgi:hypothetical protein